MSAAAAAPVLAQFLEGGDLQPRVRVVAIIVAAILFLITVELVRRRRLVERYALLWLTGAVALLALAVFPGLLETLGDRIGVEAPANGLFLIALGIIYVILLHFSVAISRLGDEAKLLAQEVARLEYELRTEREARQNGGDGRGRSAAAEQADDQAPVGPQREADRR